MKVASSASKSATVATAKAPRHVAYHEGPPEITFSGRTWRAGVPQPVSEEEWAAMQARGDFPEFDFRPVINGAPNTEDKE